MPEGKWIFDNSLYNKFAAPYTEDYVRKNLLPFANGNNPMSLVGTKKHFTDAIGDMVIDQLAQTDRKKPFSMWVAFHAIHSAIVSRDDLYEKYKSRTQLDERHENYKYAALTEQLDQTVGRILAALDDPNGDGDNSDSMRDNTVVIFMSDNGGIHGGNHSNAPLRWAKGTLYEGGTRVPMMVRYPKMIKPNAICNELVHVIDFFPTWLDLAGVKYTRKEHVLDGESLVPLLSGRKNRLNRDKIFWHFPGYMDERGIPASVVNKRIGDKRYKYRYCYEYDTHELYNITDDIGEKNNLLEGNPSQQNIAIANELLTALTTWIDETNPLPMHYVADGKVVKLPRNIR
jgi:arylsulfatase A-like enzyme